MPLVGGAEACGICEGLPKPEDDSAKLEDGDLEAKSAKLNTGEESEVEEGKHTAMSLDFRDKKLGRILKKIEKVAKLRIVVPKEVAQRRVTVKFTSTPWDEILDSLLRANGLGYVSDGSTIEVAPITKH